MDKTLIKVNEMYQLVLTAEVAQYTGAEVVDDPDERRRIMADDTISVAGADPVYDSDNVLLAPSRSAMNEAERAAVAAQRPRFGPGRNQGQGRG